MDENIQSAIVEALLAAGEDMVTVADLALSAADIAIVPIAGAQGRLLLTADKDFGDLESASTVAVPPHPTAVAVPIDALVESSWPAPLA